MVSYMSDRSQCVQVNSQSSPTTSLNYGVPQGSVLGPVLFSLYMKPVTDILNKHDISYHLYADDLQIYTNCPVENLVDTIRKLELCVSEVKDWLTCNMLSMNGDKTEFIIFSTPFKQPHVENFRILFNNLIAPSKTVKNLGFVLDNSLTLDKQISNTCKSSFIEIRRIAKIRNYLTTEIANKLATCFILPRLDYCNILYAGLPDKSLKRLQLVQNSAARLVVGKKKHDHISAELRKLHWLPVRERILHKIGTSCYKAINGISPLYISRMLDTYIPPRTLRSSNKTLLRIPKTKLKTYGERSFYHQGPVVWNNLPENVKSAETLAVFKKLLKTHFFAN